MPEVLGINLSASERRALTRQRERVESLRTWKRMTGILLLASGLAVSAVLEHLGVSRRTLLNWKHRWLKRRHFGFEDAERSGRPPVVTRAYMRELLRVVRRDPRECGYAFTRWTAPRLAQYLFEVTDIRVTPQWVTELLRMRGIVWRKTKRTIRNLQNPVATKRAQRALRRLKKGVSERARTSNSGLQMAFDSICFRSRSTPTGIVDVRW